MFMLADLLAQTELRDDTAGLLHAWVIAILGDLPGLDARQHGPVKETFALLLERLGQDRYTELQSRALTMSAADLLQIVADQHRELVAASGDQRTDPQEN